MLKHYNEDMFLLLTYIHYAFYLFNIAMNVRVFAFG
jgi:hypothetical protein